MTRFAPSPTGHLHVGGARTALFCWAFARRTGGSFLLRIEDTDQARSSEASARGILEDLAWLGIEWDQGPVLVAGDKIIGGDPRRIGPFYQSQRLDTYNAKIEEMIDRGSAYADFTSTEQLAAMRKAAEAKKETFRYHPAASEILPIAEQRARIKDGVSHVVRLRAVDEPVKVIDEVLGDVSFSAGEVDDFVLRKADGFPTYHFGVVMDDELMGVTHVLRGQEHLMNTPRHVALQRALGFRTPVYAHMPLIFNDQGAKMSKRERDKVARDSVKQAGLKDSPIAAIDADTFKGWIGDTKRQLETEQLEALADHMKLRLPEVSVHDFRKAGYLPEVICNFIALLGWNPGMKNPDGTDFERFDMDFLAKNFDLARIGKTNSRFDRNKLAAFNKDAMARMDDMEFVRRFTDWCVVFAPEFAKLPSRELGWLCSAIKLRTRTFADAVKENDFFIKHADVIAYDAKAVEKVLKKDNGKGLATLRQIAEVLGGVNPFEPTTIHSTIETFASQSGLGLGDVAQPLRVAMSGGTVTPPLEQTLAVLGESEVQTRIARCLSTVG